MIEITSDAIERVGTLLADVPKGAERVFASAMVAPCEGSVD